MHAPFPEPCNIFLQLCFFSIHFPLDLLSSMFIISARRAPRSGLSSCWAILKYYQSITNINNNNNNNNNNSNNNNHKNLDRYHWRLLSGRQTLSSICRQQNDLSVSLSLPPPSSPPPPPPSLSLPIYLSTSQFLPRPLPVSLSLSLSLSLSFSHTHRHTHAFCAYTLRFTQSLRHISASAWLRSHSVLFCFFADAS